jgi:hypothetical protein
VNPGDSCTPIYTLPYATGSSDPCNIGSTGCAFATAVEEQLDSLDATVAQLQSPPFAYASNLAELSYNNNIPGNFVPTFDTTLADTDNMIDLSLDATSIYIRTAGVYSVFVDMEVSVPATATGVLIQPTLVNTSGSQIAGNFYYQTFSFTSSPNMPLRTDGTRLANVGFTCELIANLDVGYSISFQLGVTGPTGLVSFIQTFRAGALWLREAL